MESRPKAFDIELTGACNLSCPYCYLGKAVRGRMSEETADLVLDYIASRMAQHPKWVVPEVNLYGGEPFLNWTVAQKLAKSSVERFRARVTIFTNGATATPEQVLWCLRNDVRPKRSTAGCPEAAQLTRPGGYSDKWLAEGRIWKDFAVSRRMAVTPEVAPWIAQSVHWLHMHGYYGPVDFSTDDYAQWDRKAQSAYCDGLLKLAREFVRQYRRGRVLGIENFTSFGRCIFGQSGVMVLGCGAGWQTQAITFDGRIVPCHRFLREPRESPLAGSTVSGILSGQEVDFGAEFEGRIASWRAGREDEECVKCSARQACQRGCAHVSHSVYGNMRRQPPHRCRFTKLYAGIARWINDRVGDGWWAKAATPCLPMEI